MVILAPGQSSRLSQVRLARAEVGLSPPSTDSSPGYDGAMRVNLGQALSKRPGGQIAGQKTRILEQQKILKKKKYHN